MLAAVPEFLHAVDNPVPRDPLHICWKKQLEKCGDCKKKKKKWEITEAMENGKSGI